MKILTALLLSLAFFSCTIHYVRTPPVVEEVVVIEPAPPVYLPFLPQPPEPEKPKCKKPSMETQKDNTKRRPDKAVSVQRPQRAEREQSESRKPQSSTADNQRPQRTKPGSSGQLH